MKGRVRVRIGKRTAADLAERTSLDLRTPSGRVLPY